MSVASKLVTRVLKQNFNRQNYKFIKYLSSISGNRRIISSEHPDVKIPDVSIPEFIKSHLGKYDNLIAYECGVTGKKISYRDLRKKSENLAKAFRKLLKLQEGDVVAVLLPNIPEFPIAKLGILESGLVLTTLNPIYTPDEISRQLKDSNAKAIITLAALFSTAKSAQILLKKDLPIIAIKFQNNESIPEGAISFHELTDNTIDYPNIKPRKPSDLAILPYSSGTTGLPKGVQLTHRNIVANVSQNLSPNFSFIENATENHQTVTPALLPMFHIYGLTVCSLYVLCHGCKAITLPKFTPELYLNTLRKHKPDTIFLVPPIILFLTSHPEVKREDLLCIEHILSGAAPLGALDEEKFLEKVAKPINLLQGYGLTETSPTVTITTKEQKNNGRAYPGSIGHPVPNTQLKIVDISTGEILGPNTPGELLVKGPQVMEGYHNKPKETEETFSDGWLRTGDMAYYNDDHIFFITDRLKELIKVKGFQVPPAELEEIIRDYPNVSDAAVIGVPHPLHGEVPRAYVVPKNLSDFKSEELQNFVEKKVSEYKKLRGGIAVIESIPKNPSGKILRRQLKLQYEKEQKHSAST